jgi:hypothetical protein
MLSEKKCGKPKNWPQGQKFRQLKKDSKLCMLSQKQLRQVNKISCKSKTLAAGQKH